MDCKTRSLRAGQRGFTLLELMTVISIALIMVLVGVPSFATMRKNDRLVTQTNALSGVLTGARMQAISRHRTVSVCASSNGESCSDDWSAGWIAFIDDDGDGSVDAGDTVVTVFDSVPPGVNIDFQDADVVRYSSLGYASAESRGTFVFCDDRGTNHGRAVLVSGTGRASVATDSDAPADGIVNDIDGDNIACP